MEIGIGLPATIPGVEGKTVVNWAREAERHNFSSLGVIDRIVYGNYEPLTALAAAAAVTERIRLITTILIAPLRTNTALFAKQAATVDQLSGGRLVLGLAVGGREDDFEGSGASFHSRGRFFESQLDEMKRIWGGEKRGTAGAIGPTPVQKGGIPLIIGGSSEAAVRRAVEDGVGWIAGGGGPDMFRQGAEPIRAAWAKSGRAGSPRLLGLTYFALGPNATNAANSYLKDYYAFAGPFAERIAASALVTEQMVKQAVESFTAAGCDELIFFPCSADLNQVELLRKAT